MKARCIAKCFDNVRFYTEGEVYDVDEKTLAQFPSAFVVDALTLAALPPAEDGDPDPGGGSTPPPDGTDPVTPNEDPEAPPLLELKQPAQNPSAEAATPHGLGALFSGRKPLSSAGVSRRN